MAKPDREQVLFERDLQKLDYLMSALNTFSCNRDWLSGPKVTKIAETCVDKMQVILTRL
jgi:hypothetical protein